MGYLESPMKDAREEIFHRSQHIWESKEEEEVSDKCDDKKLTQS
jgi:hypothetical protein